MSLPVGLLLVAAVAALAQAERKGVLQAVLSRPLVLSPVLGWALGDLPAGLLLAVPLELLWLGAMNIGASLPDHDVVGVSAVVGGAVLGAQGGAVTPSLAVLALVLLSPLAITGRWADERIERFNVAFAERVTQAVAAGRNPPATLNVLGLVGPSASAALLSALGAGLGAVLLPPILRALPVPVAAGLPAAWLAVGGVAGAAALTAIRIRGAVRVGGVAAGVALLAVVLAWMLSGGAA